jgi:hypothetical protein
MQRGGVLRVPFSNQASIDPGHALKFTAKTLLSVNLVNLSDL